jgi:hypothetical protein
MPPRKPSPKRTNPGITGIFEEHLQFLRRDTGLANTNIIRMAVAEMAKSRGFVTPAEVSQGTRTRPKPPR